MFDSPHQPGPPTATGWLATALIWTGALLLVTGALLAGPSLAPYVASRLYPLPTVQTLDPPPTPTPTATPVPAMVSAAASPGPALLPLFQSPPEKPATPAAASPSPTPTPPPVGYPPTRIVIPSIGADAPVVPTSWQMMETGGSVQPVWMVPEAHSVGWHEESALLGVPGNTVINGHNWPEYAVFRDLYQVKPGDQVILYSGGMPFAYQVTETMLLPEANQPLEVRQANARYIQPTDDERVTLVTCHPYGRMTYRLIVIARPVEPGQPGSEED